MRPGSTRQSHKQTSGTARRHHLWYFRPNGSGPAFHGAIRPTLEHFLMCQGVLGRDRNVSNRLT